MEHRSDLKFSKDLLSRELDRLKSFMRILKEDYKVYKVTLANINSVEGALKILDNIPAEFDPTHSIRHLRTTLTWLRDTVKVLPHQQSIIDEIEYVTKLLKSNGKN
jgi:hypothetical protein